MPGLSHWAHSRHNIEMKLVVYPGETTRPDGTTIGSIYVVGGEGEKYPMAGGPPPGKGRRDRGGHTAGQTPAGDYVLDHAEHHTTKRWPASVIPWGAALREEDGEVQYEVNGRWITATGRHGTVAEATRDFLNRDGRKATDTDLDAAIRQEILFTGPGGTLPSTYAMNDFGNLSWNMKKKGQRTAYYVHTTALNEAQEASSQVGAIVPVVLDQSHGCIHITPADRIDMVTNRYLKAGRKMTVKKYGLVGPP
jgi:hypothetical protein